MNTMNTASSSGFESARNSQVAPAPIPATQLLRWSIRRELWENRAVYLAPLAVAAVFLFGFLISLFRLPEKVRAAQALDEMQRQQVLQQPYSFAALLMMGTTFIVAVIYCLDALHGERRDRSILFWKSLPVSDLTIVLSKASIPILALPLIGFVLTVAMQWIMLVMSSAALVAGGVSVSLLWSEVSWLQLSLMLFFHLVALHGFWYAPIYAWLLLVSGWARRAVLLWAGLPLVAIALVEKLAFNTMHFAGVLEHRFSGSDPFPVTGGMAMHPLTFSSIGNFLISPGLWIGLVVATVFLGAAVRLRRDQGPI